MPRAPPSTALCWPASRISPSREATRSRASAHDAVSERTVFLADEGRREAIIRLDVVKAEAALVRQPPPVGRLGVDAEEPENLVLAGLHRDPITGGAMRAGRLDCHQVPGPGPKSVGPGGESADRTDLNRVAGEVGREGKVRERC